MIRNTNEAAGGADNISANILGVAQAADGTLSKAARVTTAAQELASVAAEVNRLMRQFKIERQDRRFDVSLPVTLWQSTPTAVR